MQQTQKIVDFYAMVEIDKDLNPNNYEFVKEKNITSLLLVSGFYGGDVENELNSENEIWQDLDSTRTLWLKINFDQKDQPAITQVEFLYVAEEQGILKIPITHDILPVPIKQMDSFKFQNKLIGSQDNFRLYQGDYNLTNLLGYRPQQGYHLILSYQIQSKNNPQPALSNIKVEIAQKKQKTDKTLLSQNNSDYKLIISNKNQFVVQFLFGKPEKNRMLVAQKRTCFSKIAYCPKIVDRYPNDKQADIVPMFCFPEGIYLSKDCKNPSTFSFILTQEDGKRAYGTCITFSEPIDSNIEKQLGVRDSKDQIYTQKALCLISRKNYYHQFREILKEIYRLSLSKTEIPIERYICNVVNDIRCPDLSGLGKVACQFNIGKSNIIFTNTFNYPFFAEKSLENLFRVLDSKKIIDLFESILLERKICLISKHKSLLTQVADGLLSLIFPFVYQHVLIPVFVTLQIASRRTSTIYSLDMHILQFNNQNLQILPDNLRAYIDAPVPFIIGINSESVGTDEINFSQTQDVIQAYLDSGDLIYFEAQPPLLEKAYKQLCERLKIYDKMNKDFQIIEQIDNAFFSCPDDFDDFAENFNAHDIKDAFMEFISSFMKNYQKFFVNSKKEQQDSFQEFQEIFNAKKFLDDNKSLKQGTFLDKFVETSIFSTFITDKVGDPNSSYYQFFDNQLKLKRSKKEPILLKPEPYEKVIQCNGPSEQSIQKDKNYFYERFPIMDHKFTIQYIQDQNQIKQQTGPQISILQKIEVNNLDDQKWAKLMLECIYSMYFIVLSVRIKNLPLQCFRNLVDYSINMLDDFKKYSIKGNLVIFRSLIEACAVYDKWEQLQLIINIMQRQGFDISWVIGFYQNKSSQKQTIKVDENQIHQKSNEDQKNISFIFDQSCTQCQRVPFPDEIFSGWKKSFNEYVTKCQCGQLFKAQLRVCEIYQNEKILSSSFNLYSPVIIQKELENFIINNGDILLTQQSFASDHRGKIDNQLKEIYWNLSFYFSLIDAPIFILQYLSQQQYQQKSESLISDYFGQNDMKRSNSIFQNYTQQMVQQPDDKSNDSGQNQSQSDQFGTYKNTNQKFISKQEQDKQNHSNSIVKRYFGNLLKELNIKSDKYLNQVEFQLSNTSFDTSDIGEKIDKIKIK